jgi:hypothetical protein
MGFGTSGGLMVGQVGPCMLFGQRRWASLPKRGDEETGDEEDGWYSMGNEGSKMGTDTGGERVE